MNGLFTPKYQPPLRWLLLFCAALCGGCSTTTASRNSGIASVSAVVHSLSEASAGADRAKASLHRASTAAGTLADSTALTTLATNRRSPEALAFSKLRVALASTGRELDLLSAALTQSSERALLLEGRVNGMARDLSLAQERVREAEEGSRVWRGRSLKAAGIVGALLLWIFRRPLLTLVGIV